MSLFFFGNNFYKNKESFKIFSWQHSSNSNNKIVHNSIEHFLCNLSDFFSDDVLFCLWIVFTNSVFQVPPQKIVRRVEILGIGWSGVIGLMQNESVPWEVMPEVFKCSVWEMRWHLISRADHSPHFSNRTLEYLRHNLPWVRIPHEMLNRAVDNFNVRVAAVLSCSSAVHGTNIALITEKV